MSAPIEVVAHRNTNVVSSYKIQNSDGSAFDFASESITRVQVAYDGKSIDSTTDDVSFNDDILSIRWGSLEVEETNFAPVVYVYRGSDDNLGSPIAGSGLAVEFSVSIYKDHRPQT